MVDSLFSKPLWHTGYVHSLQDHVSAVLGKISPSMASLPLSLTFLLFGYSSYGQLIHCFPVCLWNENAGPTGAGPGVLVCLSPSG